MLNRSGEKNLCFVPEIKGKAFSFPVLSKAGVAIILEKNRL